MKITCVVLCVLGLAALATADLGFVPRAFYKLDSDGHKSNIHEINPHEANILRRLRRQTFGGSSSSSSTSYGTDGGPVYFSSHQTVQQSPGLESRFGGGSTGHAVHTTGVFQDGRIIYQDTKHEKL